MNVLLSIVSIILVLIVGTAGFIWGLVRSLFHKGQLKKYFYKIALTLDQTGNVVAQFMLNDVLIKPNGYRAGCEDDTLSQVLAINTLHYPENRLYAAGKALGWILDKIDKNHLEKAYENFKLTERFKYL